jgi:hypothetical protein
MVTFSDTVVSYDCKMLITFAPPGEIPERLRRLPPAEGAVQAGD